MKIAVHNNRFPLRSQALIFKRQIIDRMFLDFKSSIIYNATSRVGFSELKAEFENNNATSLSALPLLRIRDLRSCNRYISLFA